MPHMPHATHAPLPCTLPSMDTPCHACPLLHTPLAMHASLPHMPPCHAHPLPWTPPAMHAPCHTCPPAMHAPCHTLPLCHACPLPHFVVGGNYSKSSENQYRWLSSPQYITRFLDWKLLKIIKSCNMSSIIKFYLMKFTFSTDQWLRLSHPVVFINTISVMHSIIFHNMLVSLFNQVILWWAHIILYKSGVIFSGFYSTLSINNLFVLLCTKS